MVRLAKTRAVHVVSPLVITLQPVGVEFKKVGNSMVRVEARSGESLDKTLRRFKKLCEKEGLSKEVRKNQYYEKPSARRRRKQRKSEKERSKR